MFNLIHTNQGIHTPFRQGKTSRRTLEVTHDQTFNYAMKLV